MKNLLPNFFKSKLKREREREGKKRRITNDKAFFLRTITLTPLALGTVTVPMSTSAVRSVDCTMRSLKYHSFSSFTLLFSF